MKKFYFTLILFFGVSGLYSQVDDFNTGARSLGLSGATSALVDRWAVFSNPANLAFLKETSAGVYIENKFNIKQLYSGAFVFNYGKGKSAFNINYFTFNNSVIYSRQKFGLAYSLRLGKSFSAGIGLDFINTHVDEYGNDLCFAGDAGIYYSVSKKLNIGVSIFNPTFSNSSAGEDEKLPTVMKTGADFVVSDKTNILLEIQNSSLSGFAFKGGLEYKIRDRLTLMLGSRSNPVSFSGGLDFSTRKLTIRVALQYQQVLDATPGAGFDYVFKKIQ